MARVQRAKDREPRIKGCSPLIAPKKKALLEKHRRFPPDGVKISDVFFGRADLLRCSRF